MDHHRNLKKRTDWILFAAQDIRATRAGDFGALLDVGVHLRRIDHDARMARAHWAALAVEAGASWKQIGDALGISKQAAQQRYGSMWVDQSLPMDA